MKHIRELSKTPLAGQTTIALKLQATIDIVDRLLLAQRQAAWKVPYPLEGGDDDGTDTTDTTDSYDGDVAIL